MFAENHDGLFDRPHNICVIGAGPVGIATALELARRGQAVTLIESGGMTSNPDDRPLSAAVLAEGGRHADMTLAVERSFGGTSNLWGAGCVPLDPIDLEERRGLDPLCAWPISHGELSGYFAEACRYANCGRAIFEAPVPGLATRDARFSAAGLIRYADPASFRTAHRREMGRSRLVTVFVGATVTDLDFAADGRVSGALVRCRSGRSGTLRARTFVVACGGVETARLLLAAQRGAPGRFGGPDGPLGRYYMGHLSGQIATIELLDPALDDSLGFHLGQAGRYRRRRLTASADLQQREGLTNIAFWPVMPPLRDPGHGNAVLSLAYLALSFKPIGGLIVSEYLRRSNAETRTDVLPHLANILRDIPGLVGFIPKFLHGRFLARTKLPGLHVPNRGRRYSLHYHAEHLPNRQSRVSLSPEVDALGMPRAYIDLRFGDRDVEPVLRTHALLADWLSDNGLGRLEWLQPPAERAARVLAQVGDGVHQIGTARMAASERDGVVDRDCRVFGSPNLFLAGSAVFPTSGQANPTFTAIALAVRLGRRLAAETQQHAIAA